MKRFISVLSIAFVLSILCILSFVPTGYSFGSTYTNHVQSNSANSPLSYYKLYDLTLSAKPKSIKIRQSTGSDCESYPVCGNGTVNFNLDNKGKYTFTTDGSCSETVTPSPVPGRRSENLGCSGIPLFALPSGDGGTLTWTQMVYNWPSGKYNFTLFIEGTVGSSRFVYQSKNGTFDATVTG